MKTKQQKRLEAEARQVEYNNLTLKEKLERIDQRPGQSMKETARLIERANNEN